MPRKEYKTTAFDEETVTRMEAVNEHQKATTGIDLDSVPKITKFLLTFYENTVKPKDIRKGLRYEDKQVEPPETAANQEASDHSR